VNFIVKRFQNRLFQTLCLLFAASAWKLVFLLRGAVSFNSDEAVVALMARHILQGERPIFFYGQAYMGSLDAWLVAAGFALFGEGVWVVRLVQLLLYLGTIVTTVVLGDKIFSSWRVGLLSGLFLAIPAVNTTLYTTASLGGYGEALLIGNLTLLAALSLGDKLKSREPEKSTVVLSVLWGFFAGFGLWANGLTLVYSAPSGLYLLWLLISGRKKTGLLVLIPITAGVLIGAIPWLLFAAQNGMGSLVHELLGSAVAVDQRPWAAQVGARLVSFLLLGATALFGFRPPWEVRWLALPLMPFALAFWLGCLAWVVRRLARRSPNRPQLRVLVGVIITLSAGFLFTSFGNDPSGRYFVPLAIPLALFAGDMLVSLSSRFILQAAVTAAVVLFNIWGTFQAAVYPPGLTTQFYEPSMIDHRYDQALINFLLENGETRGYSNYWVCYPLAFQSGERVIYIPALPYHLDLSYTARDDRYPPYTEEVAKSQRVAYIITRNPPLRAALRGELERLGVEWQEKQIGDFEIFYRLSEPVRPEELDLTGARGPQG
jgi:4-amino-4-deoxy-L-arabinose transferase-like glycosyltransferase